MAYLGRRIHQFSGMDSDPAWRELVAMVPPIGSTWKEAGDEFKPKGLKKNPHSRAQHSPTPEDQMGIGISQVVTSGQKLTPNASWTFFVYPPPPPQPSIKTLNNLVSARVWINKITFPALVKWRLKTKIQLLQKKKVYLFCTWVVVVRLVPNDINSLFKLFLPWIVLWFFAFVLFCFWHATTEGLFNSFRNLAK